MSWIALGWASQQKPGRVADKMVLIALADRHNEESGVSYPSVAWLAEFSCLDRKTVVSALDRLEALGLIADSGLRVGKTKQVKAYTLNLNSPEKGIPETEPFAANSPVFSVKQSQKRDTEPSLEPSTKTKKAHTLPNDWKPRLFSTGSKCGEIMAQWPPGESETQVEHFTAHHRAKGSRFVDWQDAWQTWVLNSRKWNSGNGRGSNQVRGRSSQGRSSLARAIDEGLEWLG